MGKIGRVMTLFIMLMMLASPLASAQQAPATPEGEVPPVSAPVTSGDEVDDTGDSDGSPSGDENVDSGEGEDLVTPDPSGEDAASGADTEGDGTTPDVDSGEVIDEASPESQEREELPVGTEEIAPAAAPAMQTLNGDMGIQATRQLVVTVVTSDGAAIPDGTEVCIWPSDEYCQDWDGEALTFSLYQASIEYDLYAPDDSDYAGDFGSLRVPAGPAMPLTLTLKKKATVTVDLAPNSAALDGTEVCLWNSDENCQDWHGEAMSFRVWPGDVEYEVYTPEESGYAEAFGSFIVAPGENVNKTFILQAPATVTVDVVTADGGEVPDWVDVCLTPSRDGCWLFEGETLTFEVTPGEVEYEVYLDWDGAYREAFGTITIAPNESRNLTIELQPKDPAKLRVYVSTLDGQPVPAGTEICVDMEDPEFGDPVDDLCQTVNGSYTTFQIGQGLAEITVTPPADSGYTGETASFWTYLDETTRAVFELERTGEPETGHLEFTVSTEDGAALTIDDFEICVYLDDLLSELFGCGGIDDEVTQNPDGSITVDADGPVGTFKYAVVPTLPGYGAASGSFTIVSGETTTISAVLPVIDEQNLATLIVNVVTVDGSPVPEGTLACVLPIYALEDGLDEEDVCRPWAGDSLSFQVPATLVLYMAGILEEESLRSMPGMVVLAPGEIREVTITIYPEDFEPTITHTVSNANPKSGDTVTYIIHALGQEFERPTLRAWEPEFDFQIENVLPAELTDVTVSCAGTYTASIPGICHELEDGVLTIFGEYAYGLLSDLRVFDITVTVTGTIVGEPGTVVSNMACLGDNQGGEIPVDPLCSTAALTIAQDEAPEPTDPATPEPTDPATPEPTDPATPEPTDPATPEPTDPATPEPTDPATPEAESPVTALPKTGNGAGAAASWALYAGLAAAMLLGGAGVFVRSRQSEQ